MDAMWPWLWLGLLLVASASHRGQWAPECGSNLTAPRGHFHSPNFPGPFQVPVVCDWVIQAPAASSSTIYVYFTQFYLRDAISAKEYLSYPFWHSRGAHDLGTFRPEVNSFVTSSKEYLVVRMVVHELMNANLRVLPALMDVYGFNFTYEIVDATPPPRPTPCTVVDCSFNGECLANADYTAFACRCFDGFEGDRCQYGPLCDARRNVNAYCARGRLCRFINQDVWCCWSMSLSIQDDIIWTNASFDSMQL